MATTLDAPPETFHDFSKSAGGRAVDLERGIIYGVRIIGMTSKNNRRYTETALRTAIPKYEGVKVNIDHPDGTPGKPRGVADRFGVLKNVVFESGGLKGDLHYLVSHPLANQIAEMARRMSNGIGLSHNAQGRSRRESGLEVIDNIDKVLSVDLVADPASTNGLFEHLLESRGARRPEREVGLIEAITGRGPRLAADAREFADRVRGRDPYCDPAAIARKYRSTDAELFAEEIDTRAVAEKYRS